MCLQSMQLSVGRIMERLHTRNGAVFAQCNSAVLGTSKADAMRPGGSVDDDGYDTRSPTVTRPRWALTGLDAMPNVSAG